MSTTDHAAGPACEDNASWQRQRIGFDELSSPIAIHGYQYWTQLRQQRPFAARKEIIPRDIAPILRNVVIVRVLNGGQEFESRVAGDIVIQLHGHWTANSTTADLDSRFPGFGRLVRRIYWHVYQSRKPVALRGEVKRQSRDIDGVKQLFQHETVFVPLGETDGPVDHILGFCDVIGTKFVHA